MCRGFLKHLTKITALVGFLTLVAVGCTRGPCVTATSAERAARSIALNSAAPPVRQASVDSNPLTLTVQKPSGVTSHLFYVSEYGWQLDDPDALLKPGEARISPTSVGEQYQAAGTEQPITVFIDGPTGFTYVWLRDQGWKFVGRLSDHNR
jgi:hypothetical protein